MFCEGARSSMDVNELPAVQIVFIRNGDTCYVFSFVSTIKKGFGPEL